MVCEGGLVYGFPVVGSTEVNVLVVLEGAGETMITGGPGLELKYAYVVANAE